MKIDVRCISDYLVDCDHVYNRKTLAYRCYPDARDSGSRCILL